MTDARMWELLRAQAKHFIEQGKQTIRGGRDVLPIAYALRADGNVAMIAVAGATDEIDRWQILRLAVQEHNADGILFFSDAWKKDAAGKRVGEFLLAYIELKSDPVGKQVVCEYTRDPLHFGAVETYETASWLRPIFDRPAH